MRAMLLVLCAMWILPELAHAKHARTTRHYKFNVCYMDIQFNFVDINLIFVTLFFIFIFADQIAKCDKALSNKEHCNRQRTISWS